MKIEVTFLRSRVAYRIFTLFVLCALLPVSLLAVLSFVQVRTELYAQAKTRIRQAAKTTGFSIYERLLFLEDEIKLIASNPVIGFQIGTQDSPGAFSDHMCDRLKGAAIVTEAGNQIPLIGRLSDPPELARQHLEHVRSGKTLVIHKPCAGQPPSVWMGRSLDFTDPTSGMLWAEINPEYLWDTETLSDIPPMTEFSVLDDANNILTCTPGFPQPIPEHLTKAIRASGVGQIEVEHHGDKYLTSYWSLFLGPRFLAPKWTVVLGQPNSDLFAPLARFKKIFLPVILASFLIVLFLSVVQIRRSMIPLERLQEGTKRIAARDFDSRVSIRSGDEFEDLGASFNTMATRLGKQFKALTTMADIDREILSTLDTQKVVDTLVTRLPDVLACNSVGVILMDDKNPEEGILQTRDGDPDNPMRSERVWLPWMELDRFSANPERLLISEGRIPDYLLPMAESGEKSFLVLPVFVREKLSAVMALGYLSSTDCSDEDMTQARQLANQMAVAFSNARLIEELKVLNWSVLTTLARTIDAKSPWTAGHSERVTTLAVDIGKALGLGLKELDVLHRGGLLHDTGKIGTPAEILDKPGKLNETEMRLMREHVRIGARILEPIPACADILPIVLQHHERFDGLGYPDGISGESISLGARIFSVADCFDALISDRPYRARMPREEVIESIKQESGTKFDPKVVQAFLQVMESENRTGRAG